MARPTLAMGGGASKSDGQKAASDAAIDKIFAALDTNSDSTLCKTELERLFALDSSEDARAHTTHRLNPNRLTRPVQYKLHR